MKAIIPKNETEFDSYDVMSIFTNATKLVVGIDAIIVNQPYLARIVVLPKSFDANYLKMTATDRIVSNELCYSLIELDYTDKHYGLSCLPK